MCSSGPVAGHCAALAGRPAVGPVSQLDGQELNFRGLSIIRRYARSRGQSQEASRSSRIMEGDSLRVNGQIAA